MRHLFMNDASHDTRILSVSACQLLAQEKRAVQDFISVLWQVMLIRTCQHREPRTKGDPSQLGIAAEGAVIFRAGTQDGSSYGRQSTTLQFATRTGEDMPWQI